MYSVFTNMTKEEAVKRIYIVRRLGEVACHHHHCYLFIVQLIHHIYMALVALHVLSLISTIHPEMSCCVVIHIVLWLRTLSLGEVFWTLSDALCCLSPRENRQASRDFVSTLSFPVLL